MKYADEALIFERVMEEPVGIAIKTSDPKALRNRLYAAKRAMPYVPPLSFISPPVGAENTLWVVKRGEADGEEI